MDKTTGLVVTLFRVSNDVEKNSRNEWKKNFRLLWGSRKFAVSLVSLPQFKVSTMRELSNLATVVINQINSEKMATGARLDLGSKWNCKFYS